LGKTLRAKPDLTPNAVADAGEIAELLPWDAEKLLDRMDAHLIEHIQSFAAVADLCEPLRFGPFQPRSRCDSILARRLTRARLSPNSGATP
jgi:hypothetical protein